MLLALKQEVNTKAELDDAEVLSQAKIYAEDLFANVPRPNLDDYYKKSEADAKIDEKINAIELPIASATTLGGIKVGANLSIDADGTLNASESKTSNGEVLPIGTMIPFGSANNIPTNWRICDGSEVSRTDYAELFNVIGTSYGEGDGATTFNLPDKRGRVSVGLDSSQTEFSTIGKKGGEKTHKLNWNEMPAHSHAQKTIGNDGNVNPWVTSANSGAWGVETRNQYAYRGGTGTYLLTDNAGGNQAHNNLQPYEVDVWIIKVSNSSGISDTENAKVIDNLTSISSTDALSANMGRELNEKLNWKLHITVYGTNTISLPHEYNELYIEIARSGNTDPTMSLYIPKISLTDYDKVFKGGHYFNSSYNGAFTSTISLTTYKLDDLYINGVAENSIALTNVYYR